MTEWIVQFEPRKPPTFDVTVQADSIGEAIKIASDAHVKGYMYSLTANPVAADTKEHASSHDELRHEVVGSCCRCHAGLVNGEIPGQPWNYTSDPTRHHNEEALLCYACAKEVGIT